MTSRPRLAMTLRLTAPRYSTSQPAPRGLSGARLAMTSRIAMSPPMPRQSPRRRGVSTRPARAMRPSADSSPAPRSPASTAGAGDRDLRRCSSAPGASTVTSSTRCSTELATADAVADASPSRRPGRRTRCRARMVRWTRQTSIGTRARTRTPRPDPATTRVTRHCSPPSTTRRRALYLRGDPDVLAFPQLAIVGARQSHRSGRASPSASPSPRHAAGWA